MLRKKVILALSALLLLWIMGFVGFIFYTRSFIIIDRSVTDAIIVFTGGRQRIKTGVSLLKAGYAPILFISGVESPVELKNFLIENNVPIEQVIYGLNAGTTKDNALEVNNFVNNYNITSIRLVTSSYHMPRAYAETRRLISPTVTIIPHAFIPTKNNYLVLFKEYHKYLIVILMQIFE